MNTKSFSTLDISWDVIPEDAVTLFLEWGNNSWKSDIPPIRNDDDYLIYFVLDTWGEYPLLKLLHRTKNNVLELYTTRLPKELEEEIMNENNGKPLKGIYKPNNKILNWIKKEIS